MSDDVIYPTPYPDVNAVLHDLLAAAQSILGNHFVGLYLDGSLASGDFDPRKSDIDFVVVTADALPEEMIRALAEMHERQAAGGSRWAGELEGSYIPQQALRRYDPTDARHPHIERGGRLSLAHQESDWVIHRHILREQGVAIAGPAPHTLIDPVHPNELRQAVLTILRGWWGPMRQDPTRLHSPGYRAYAILTMCRMLYTLDYGAIVSKPAAGRWAQAALGERWARLIERALAWPDGPQPDYLKETLAFIGYTLERSQ